MENFEPKKLALVRIWQILKEYSDYDHPLTQKDIAIHLEDDYGIVIERKAIGRNISLLKESGFDIETNRKGSYIVEREFEDSELHMLIDGIISSKHITAAHSKDLIERICRLSNKYFKSTVNHIYSVNEWNKTDNKQLFYNIELIDEAIDKGYQIHYDYNKYDLDMKLHKTSHQYVSPYQMIIHNQRYYLMAYSEYWEKIVFHRLDRLTNMQILEQQATKINTIEGFENGINYKELSSSMPYMYTDKIESIEFIADVGIIDQIVDWFGTDIYVKRCDKDDKKMLVRIKASPNAMEHWFLQYTNHVEVIKPESLRQRVRECLLEAIKKY